MGIWVLRFVVLLGCALHALFLPVFEGPDEPFHLARARQFERGTLEEALQGSLVDAEVVSAIRSWPCGQDLARAFGCPPYAAERAAFNILGPSRQSGPAVPVANYQAHQPPLYYAAAGAAFEAASWIGIESPEKQLLVLRLCALGLVAAVLFGPASRMGKLQPGWETLLLGSLLVPGAAESLIRVSSDVAIFAWAAFLLAALASESRLGRVIALLSIGPLLKLTAWPLCAFGVVVLARSRGYRSALLGAMASLLVLPLQLLRGWRWGGTLEITQAGGWSEGLPAIVGGVAHSALTFLKTAFWLGGWSGIRPPLWLLVLTVALASVACGLALRFRIPPQRWLAHVAAAAVFASGFVVFAVGKRGVFGVWGAVGGWYFWGLAPWVALAAGDLLKQRHGRAPHLMLAAGLILIISNVVWLREAIRLYGW